MLNQMCFFLPLARLLRIIPAIYMVQRDKHHITPQLTATYLAVHLYMVDIDKDDVT